MKAHTHTDTPTHRHINTPTHTIQLVLTSSKCIVPLCNILTYTDKKCRATKVAIG